MVVNTQESLGNYKRAPQGGGGHCGVRVWGFGRPPRCAHQDEENPVRLGPRQLERERFEWQVASEWWTQPSSRRCAHSGVRSDCETGGTLVTCSDCVFDSYDLAVI